MSVWMVDHGSYSDYMVDGLFSSEEKAREYARRERLKSTWTEYDVTEWELDPETEEPKLQYAVWVSGDADSGPLTQPDLEPTYREVYPVVRLNGRGRWSGVAVGATLGQALKSAHDLIAKEKARAEGLT